LAAYTSCNEADHSLVIKAHDKMALLAKIINETKNKYEKEVRIKDIRLMIQHLKDKTNVITAICTLQQQHNRLSLYSNNNSCFFNYNNTKL